MADTQMVLSLMSFFAFLALSTQDPTRDSVQNNYEQTMKHLKRNYLFVQKIDNLKLFPNPGKPRSGRSVTIPSGGKICPWVWVELPRKRSQVPQVLKEAQCPGCASHCRPVTYPHRVLQRELKRDSKTDFRIWRWTEKTLAVAFVYDPEY